MREFPSRQVLRSYERGLITMTTRRFPLQAEELHAMSTQGTALVSKAIAQDPEGFARYTWARELVVVVSDGSAVLGLGDLGPHASLPVLEAKCAFLKMFADIDAVPLIFGDTGVDGIVDALVALRPSFGAVSIEDVRAPRCFELERRLRAALDCPVMHNDQHGTAVAVTAALRNAATLRGQDLASMRVVIVGAGAAGSATARLVASAGVSDLVVVDTKGIIHPDRHGLLGVKRELSRLGNPRDLTGGLAEALDGADVLIGLSSTKIPEALLRTMNRDPVILALANPEPEVSADAARAVGALHATGRASDPNCVTNLLAIPGIFRGAFSAGSREITDAMLHAAVDGLVQAGSSGLDAGHLVPDLMDPTTHQHVINAVRAAAPTAPQPYGASCVEER